MSSTDTEKTTDQAIQRAARTLLELQYERLQRRLNLKKPPAKESAALRTAFFYGVSSGLDIGTGIYSPLPTNVTALKIQTQ